MAQIIWPKVILEVLEELPERERSFIFEKISRLETFPEMYPQRLKGPFRRCRWFLAGNWLVYYRFVEGTVCIRALWPARAPNE